MPKIEWDGWKINLGHVLTMGTVLGSVIVAYSTLRAEVSTLAVRQAEDRGRIEKLVQTDLEIRERVAAMDRDTIRAVTRLEARMEAIAADITRIVRGLERQVGPQ